MRVALLCALVYTSVAIQQTWIPDGCKTFYDGCNTCTVDTMGVSCTNVTCVWRAPAECWSWDTMLCGGACITLYDPVCSTNNITYSNECSFWSTLCMYNDTTTGLQRMMACNDTRIPGDKGNSTGGMGNNTGGDKGNSTGGRNNDTDGSMGSMNNMYGGMGSMPTSGGMGMGGMGGMPHWQKAWQMGSPDPDMCKMAGAWYKKAMVSESPMAMAAVARADAEFSLNGANMMNAWDVVSMWGHMESPFPVRGHFEVINSYCGVWSVALEVAVWNKGMQLESAGVDVIRWNMKSEITQVMMTRFGQSVTHNVIAQAMSMMGGGGSGGNGGMTTPSMGGGGGGGGGSGMTTMGGGGHMGGNMTGYPGGNMTGMPYPGGNMTSMGYPYNNTGDVGAVPKP